MRLILHIGAEKTGTTTLQGWFQDNRLAFRNAGVLIPLTLSTPNNRDIVHAFQSEVDEYFILQGMRSKRKIADYRLQLLKKFELEILSAKDCHTTILTSEHFHSRLTDIEDLKNFWMYAKNVFSKIVVIGYLRNQLDLATSKYSTGVQAWRTESIDQYILSNTEMHSYYDMLGFVERWNLVADGNCVFRSYDNLKKEGGDIRQDFLILSNICLQSENAAIGSKRFNSALSKRQANALRYINSRVPYQKSNGKVSITNRILKKSALQACNIHERIFGKEHITPSTDVTRIIKDKFFASNEELYQKHGIDIR